MLRKKITKQQRTNETASLFPQETPFVGEDENFDVLAPLQGNATGHHFVSSTYNLSNTDNTRTMEFIL